MDSCEAFNKLLQQLALPEGVQVQLKLREFTTPAALYWSLTADAESTFEAILSDAAVESAMAPSVLSTPTAGKLRRLLKECEKICIEGDSPTPPNTLAELALPVAASPNNQLLGIDLGPKLSAVALAKLWDDFAKNYPAEALCGDVRPCRALVQTIWLQKSHNELKFIPWKHITSEVQADREKQSCQQKDKKLLDILALAAGQVDLPECEVTSGSPYVIQKLLSLRATCWALVGWCHLGAAKLLTLKFMALYAAPGLGALGLRGPTAQEAEQADAEVCRQLAILMTNGFSLDQAIHELVEVRNGLYAWLQPRPKVTIQAPKNPRGRPGPYDKKGRGKGKDGKGKKGAVQTCHAFQAGKCTYDKCRFAHECEHCGGKDHGRTACPNLAH